MSLQELPYIVGAKLLGDFSSPFEVHLVVLVLVR